MLVQNEERGQTREDGFESKEYRSVGGGKMLLRPALNGEGGSRGEKAGDGQRDEEAGSYRQVRSSPDWEGDGHDQGGCADLDGCKLAGGDPVRGVGEREEVPGEGYRAGQREQVAETDADEEILQGRSSRCREKEQAGEGEERSDGGGPAGSGCVGGSKGGDDGEERNEDDDEAGDEG